METVTTGCENKFKNAIGGGVTKTRYKICLVERWWDMMIHNHVLNDSNRADFRDQSEELPTIAGYKRNTNAGNGLELPQLESRFSFFQCVSPPLNTIFFKIIIIITQETMFGGKYRYAKFSADSRLSCLVQ